MDNSKYQRTIDAIRLDNEITAARGRLNDGRFIAKAPPEVLEQEAQKLADLFAKRGKMNIENRGG